MKKIIAILFLLFSLNANAWLWLEPYIGYDIGTSSSVTAAAVPTDAEYNGVIYGGRLGFAWKFLMLGVDMSGLSGNAKYGSIEDIDVGKSSFGIYGGVNFDLVAIGLRAWVSYFFTNKLDSKDNVGFDEMKGNGFGIGAGLTLIRFIGINFEYRMSNYDEIIVAGSNIGGEYKPSEFVISLSVPLNLF